MVAATAINTTEKRSIRPILPVCAAGCDRIVGTAIVITPLAAGAATGRMRNAPRVLFHPDCTVGPGVGLRLHRVMRRRALAGFTADQGVTPLPRRPRQDYQFARPSARPCLPFEDAPPQGQLAHPWQEFGDPWRHHQ